MKPAEYRDRRDARRAEERDLHHRRILDAALECFARRGYAKTTVQEIAAAAGFSVGHIYNLVGNKRAVYEAVHEREHEELARVVRETTGSLADRPAIHRLDRLIDATLEYIAGRRYFVQIHQREIDLVENADLRFSTESRRRKQGFKDHLDGMLQALIVEAVEAGDLVDLPIEDLMHVYEELLSGFVARWAFGGFESDIRSKAPVIKQVLWSGLATSARARRKVQ